MEEIKLLHDALQVGILPVLFCIIYMMWLIRKDIEQMNERLSVFYTHFDDRVRDLEVNMVRREEHDKVSNKVCEKLEKIAEGRA